MSWNWKKSQHCVQAPLAMHSVAVNLESTNSLNTTTQKFSDKQDPTWGWDAFAIAFHQRSVMSAAPLLGQVPQKKEQVSLDHRNWLHVAKLCGEVSLECLGAVHAFPKLQWGSVWRKFPETLRLGQSNVTSSPKERQVAVLLRAKSNPEAFFSTLP